MHVSCKQNKTNNCFLVLLMHLSCILSLTFLLLLDSTIALKPLLCWKVGHSCSLFKNQIPGFLSLVALVRGLDDFPQLVASESNLVRKASLNRSNWVDKVLWCYVCYCYSEICVSSSGAWWNMHLKCWCCLSWCASLIWRNNHWVAMQVC